MSPKEAEEYCDRQMGGVQYSALIFVAAGTEMSNEQPGKTHSISYVTITKKYFSLESLE